MSNVIKMNREALVSALKARRRELRMFDRHAMNEHRKAERQFERDIRHRARTIAAMSYAEMVAARKDDYHFFDLDSDISQPSCPLSLEAELDAALRDLALTTQVEFTIDQDSNRWGTLYKLLTFDPDAQASMC